MRLKRSATSFARPTSKWRLRIRCANCWRTSHDFCAAPSCQTREQIKMIKHVKNFDVVRSIITGQFGVAQIGYGLSEDDKVMTITEFDSKAEAEAFAAEAR